MDFKGTIFEPNYPDRFTWLEYCVFGALLVSSMGIGVYYAFGNKNKTNEDFLMAGRSMSIFPVSLSMVCTYISAVSLLGAPLEIYFYGLQYITFNIGYLWMTLAMAYLYIPVYYNLGLTSAFEYFEVRFDRRIRVIFSIFQIILSLIYMPATVYAPSIALEEVAGIPGILSSAIIFLVCIVYSSMGGLRAVLWTDALQAFVMLGSMISIIGVGIYNVGGLDKIWTSAEETGRTVFFNFDTDPRTRYTFWTGSIGAMLFIMPGLTTTQAMIQRYLSVPSLAKAQQCIFITMVGLWVIVTANCLIGIIIFATYIDCDPIKLGKISKSDQLVPLFVMDVLGNIPFLPGLFVAGLTSGSLSSVSSALNSLAAVITEDYVKKWRPNLSETKLGLISKVISLVAGLVSFSLVFVIASVGNILPFTSVLFGLLLGPILGAATLGMFFPWTNWMGVLISIFVSVPLSLFIMVGSILAGQAGKLPDQRLPLRIDGCYVNETFGLTTTSTLSLSSYVSSSIEQPSPYWKDHEYSSLINLLSVSYIWQPTITVASTIVSGMVCSLIVAQFKTFPKFNSSYISPPMLKLWTVLLGKQKLSKWISFENVKHNATTGTGKVIFKNTISSDVEVKI